MTSPRHELDMGHGEMWCRIPWIGHKVWVRFGQWDTKRGGLEEIFIIVYKSCSPCQAKLEPSHS